MLFVVKCVYGNFFLGFCFCVGVIFEWLSMCDGEIGWWLRIFEYRFSMVLICEFGKFLYFYLWLGLIILILIEWVLILVLFV